MFSRTARGQRPTRGRADFSESDPAVHHALTSSNRFTVEGEHGGDVENWLGIEIANEYVVRNVERRIVGFVVEQGRGAWNLVKRTLLGSLRPLELLFFTDMRNVGLEMSRPFAIYFTRMEIKTGSGLVLGAVQRQVSLLARRYELIDDTGRAFAWVSGPLWRVWTFPVYDPAGRQRAVISKKWGGVVHEWHTKADTFGVDMTDHTWTPAQRAVILAATLSIDFDYFEKSGRQKAYD